MNFFLYSVLFTSHIRFQTGEKISFFINHSPLVTSILETTLIYNITNITLPTREDKFLPAASLIIKDNNILVSFLKNIS